MLVPRSTWAGAGESVISQRQHLTDPGLGLAGLVFNVYMGIALYMELGSQSGGLSRNGDPKKQQLAGISMAMKGPLG